ncbi:MAG: PKD domain-containing protein [Ferruginibacter sp.]
MKSMLLISWTILCFGNYACSKKPGAGTPPPRVNHAPLASLATTIKSVSPFVIDFKVTASDEDNDVLSYEWNFGEGTIKNDAAEVTFTYPENKTFIVKVSVTDGKSPPVIISLAVNTTITPVTIDASQKFQTMEGFGGFGAKDVYWSTGPFTSADFVNSLINDLGITILRDNIPTDFESVNDDNDPLTTDLTKFSLNSLNDRLQYLKDMKAAGLKKLIVSIWSAPPWMKTNARIDNGTTTNAAPAYNPTPTSADNQLRTDMYDEFAERCVAYIRIIKQQVGLDVYAVSLQNEPRFSQTYESCVFNGEALAALIKVVGKRFVREGLATKIFMPEDVGWYEGINSLIQPILKDAEAMRYVGMIATHGYAFDGVTASSTDAQTWKAMYNWGTPSGKPLWMTETSGFANDINGAISLSKAMYTALAYGNVSAWLFWTLSTSTLDSYSLMSSAGAKSKRYYTSKNFYRYIKPGAYRVGASVAGQSGIYPLAFKQDAENEQTIIFINDSTASGAIKLSGAGLPLTYSMFVTNENDDCKDYGSVNTKDAILLPPRAVITLYKKN